MIRTQCDYCGRYTDCSEEVVEQLAICSTCEPTVKQITQDWKPELEDVCI